MLLSRKRCIYEADDSAKKFYFVPLGSKARRLEEHSSYNNDCSKLYRDSFKKPIVIEAIDVLELMEGYRKGAKDAQHAYIDTVSLI